MIKGVLWVRKEYRTGEEGCSVGKEGVSVEQVKRGVVWVRRECRTGEEGYSVGKEGGWSR